MHFVTFLLSVLIHLSSLLKVISLHWPKQILQPPHLDTQQTSKTNSLFLNILFWSCWHVLHFLGQSVSHFNKLHKKYWFVLAVFSELWILKWSILAFYKKYLFLDKQFSYLKSETSLTCPQPGCFYSLWFTDSEDAYNFGCFYDLLIC